MLVLWRSRQEVSKTVFGDSVSLNILCIIHALSNSLEVFLTDQSTSSFWNNEGWEKKCRYPHQRCQSPTLNVPAATLSLKCYFRREPQWAWTPCWAGRQNKRTAGIEYRHFRCHYTRPSYLRKNITWSNHFASWTHLKHLHCGTLLFTRTLAGVTMETRSLLF